MRSSFDAETVEMRSLNQSDNGSDQALKKRSTLFEGSSSYAERAGRTWLIELGEWLVSAVLMAGMIALLKSYENNALPKWPYHLTLNAAAALFVVAIKAMLLDSLSECIGQLKWQWFQRERKLIDFQTFDAASRGPYGALALLWTTRGIHLSSFGAFVILLAIFTGPFVQQLVLYPSRQVPDNVAGHASIRRAQGYADIAYGSIHAVKNPSLSMKTAIYNGLFNGYKNPQALQVVPQCSTGNCTFATSYTSIAICSHCTDITSALTLPPAGTDNQCIGELSLPNDLTLQSQSSASGFVNMSNSLPMVYPNATVSRGAATLANVSVISKPDYGSCNAARATQCELYYCVNQYTGISSGNNWMEDLVASWTDLDAPATLSSTDGWINLTLTPPSSDIPVGPGESNTFYVNFVTWIALGVGLSSYLTGFVTGDIGIESSSSDAIRAFYDEGDIPTTMKNLALGMTQAMRQTPDESMPYNVTAAGVAWISEQYVEVRWSWLAMPLILQGLTLVFLLATMYSSAHSSLPAWKSKALPVLRCGLGKDFDDGWEDADMLCQMKAAGRQMTVQLRGADNGGRLLLRRAEIKYDEA